jgi:hypothetical protein
MTSACVDLVTVRERAAAFRTPPERTFARHRSRSS